MTSRIAALPTPRTNGSLAVYTSSYSRAGLNPPLMHNLVASGVPGNGTVLQSANLKSVPGIDTTPLLTPAGVSCVAEISVAVETSRLAGVRPGPGSAFVV